MVNGGSVKRAASSEDESVEYDVSRNLLGRFFGSLVQLMLFFVLLMVDVFLVLLGGSILVIGPLARLHPDFVASRLVNVDHRFEHEVVAQTLRTFASQAFNSGILSFALLIFTTGYLGLTRAASAGFPPPCTFITYLHAVVASAFGVLYYYAWYVPEAFDVLFQEDNVMNAISKTVARDPVGLAITTFRLVFLIVTSLLQRLHSGFTEVGGRNCVAHRAPDDQ